MKGRIMQDLIHAGGKITGTVDKQTDTSMVIRLNWLEGSPNDFALYLDLEDGLGVVVEDSPADKAAAVADSTSADLGIIRPSYWRDLCEDLMPGECRPAIALVGPSGNGKTTVSETVLAQLGYETIVIDCNESIEVADLIGAMSYDPKVGEVWRDGKVTKAFREGKAILFNEFDALNPRVALCLQSVFQDAGPAKKGRYVTLAGNVDEDRVYPVGDCPIILTMNTYGNGATRQYVGRNTLDAATLDRITLITTGYENEAQIIESHGYSEDVGRKLEAWARALRVKIESQALRIILSPRTLLRMAQKIERHGKTFEAAVQKEFMGRLDPDVQSLLR
jgi:hypothetical protein